MQYRTMIRGLASIISTLIPRQVVEVDSSVAEELSVQTEDAVGQIVEDEGVFVQPGTEQDRSKMAAKIIHDLLDEMEIRGDITPRQRAILSARFESHMTQEETAPLFGVQRRRITQIEGKIMRTVPNARLLLSLAAETVGKVSPGRGIPSHLLGESKSKTKKHRSRYTKGIHQTRRSDRPLTKRGTPTSALPQIDPRNPFDPAGRMHAYFQAFIDGGGVTSYDQLVETCLRISEQAGISDDVAAIKRDLNNQLWNWKHGRWGLLITEDTRRCKRSQLGNLTRKSRNRRRFFCIEVQGIPWNQVVVDHAISGIVDTSLPITTDEDISSDAYAGSSVTPEQKTVML